MNELAIGAIIEIRTANGLAYMQYTHHHPSCGEVVRLLPGLHQEPPDDFGKLVQSPGGSRLFLPLKNALARQGGPLAIVGRQPVPSWDRSFPTFRMAIRDRKGDVAYWWLWDGGGVWPQTELSEEEGQLPFRAVSSVGELIELVREDRLSSPT